MSIAKGSQWIEKLSSIQKLSRWIEKLSRLNLKNLDNNYQEKKLKRLNRLPSCREVLRSCRDCLKTVFKEEKNTDMNAIKYVTKPKIQTTF